MRFRGRHLTIGAAMLALLPQHAVAEADLPTDAARMEQISSASTALFTAADRPMTPVTAQMAQLSESNASQVGAFARHADATGMQVRLDGVGSILVGQLSAGGNLAQLIKVAQIPDIGDGGTGHPLAFVSSSPVLDRAEAVDGNLAFQHQSGRDNLARIAQSGGDNTARQTQDGTSLVSLIVQAGAGNTASISQLGSVNEAIVLQNGLQNTASVIQSGSNASAVISQAGNGNFVAVHQ